MHKSCPHCGSPAAKSKGLRKNVSGTLFRRYICKSCNRQYSLQAQDKFQSHKSIEGTKFVITAAQNDSEVNEEFLGALETYCRIHKAKLIIVPIRYLFGLGTAPEWAEEVKPYLDDMSITLCDGLRVMGNISINPTIENPIAGMDHLSKGDSLIFGHSQLQMKTLAVNSGDNPAIITTTGVVTKPSYSQTKQGEKAKFNHSFSAIVVEDDNKHFHLRVLNADDNNGFYDIDGYYTADSVTPITHIEALVTGDEHAIFACPDVKAATYTNKDSIVMTLKPRYIVRHDVLDCYTVSHHHRNSFLTKYGKYRSNNNQIENELRETLSYIEETTPSSSINIIVSSNHNDHLYRWLNEADPKQEPWNAKVYHQLMFMMLENISINGNRFDYENPFELWVNHNKPRVPMQFIKRDESYKICEIEISNHGDAGTNGSRGSLLQYSRLAFKCIIGHSHSPGISKGAYQVGTSSHLKLEYVKGPSSWLNTHCIIYPNGKRQLINILNGKWRK